MKINKKTLLFTSICIVAVLTSIFFLRNIESDNKYKEKIKELSEELKEMKKIKPGTNENSNDIVDDKVKEFIEKYYNTENISEYERLNRIKDIVTEEVYKSLIPTGELSKEVIYDTKTKAKEIEVYKKISSKNVSEKGNVSVYSTFILEIENKNKKAITSEYTLMCNVDENSFLISSINYLGRIEYLEKQS